MALQDTPGEARDDDPFRTDAGPYVLGALSPAERAAFAHHLEGCGGCRAAVADLAGLPGLLSRVPADVVAALGEDDPAGAGDGAGEVPDTVLPGLLRVVRRRRLRRRLVGAAALVAAATLLVATAGGLRSGGAGGASPQAGATPGASGPTPSGPTPSGPAATDPSAPMTVTAGPDQRMEAVMPVSITATVTLTQVGWGTEVDLVCAYAQQADARPYPYALVLTDRDGSVQQVGTWTAVPGRDAQLTGATAWRREEIARVEVRTLQGQTVLQLQEA